MKDDLNNQPNKQPGKKKKKKNKNLELWEINHFTEIDFSSDHDPSGITSCHRKQKQGLCS